MTQTAQVRQAFENGTTTVAVGDYVGFKSDVEQYGEIVAINGDRLTLRSKYGFSGDYIGGQTETVEHASDCWAE
mgnify:CR=1 FL=1